LPTDENAIAKNLNSVSSLPAAGEPARSVDDAVADDGAKLKSDVPSEGDVLTGQGPPTLGGMADTGLSELFLRGLALKAMYAYGVQSPSDVAKVLKLPVAIIRDLFEGMRGRGLLESLGAETSGRQLDLRYDLSGAGREWVQEALKQSLYAGPAPVPLKQWQAQVNRQCITNDRVDQGAIAKSLEDLVIAPEMLARFGPAVNAGRGMLLYGAPGDGKTSIARAIALSFHQAVWVPYAIEVDGEIIKIFDPALHRELVDATDKPEEPRSSFVRAMIHADDRRWVRCARPVAVIGGELTMDMLDIKYDPVGLYSEAPLHTKMTGGVLVVDDFGRQIARPEQVLNRWVLPLESRIDFLTLHTGKKFAVVFDGLVIFSTNLTPRSILDAAMMRRIPYNFHIAPPTRDEYMTIFRRVCEDVQIAFDSDVVGIAMKRLYEEEKLPMARFHPRFIVDHLVARCTYEGREPLLEPYLVLDAAEHLYTKQ